MECSTLYRIGIAAQETGVSRSTIQSAIERGEIPAYQTGCGLPLVTLADVRTWMARSHERSPGRKPAGR